MRVAGHVCHDSRNFEMLFRRRGLERENFAYRVTVAEVATCSTLRNHGRMRTNQLSLFFSFNDRKIEQVKKRGFRIAITFFDELTVTVRHFLLTVLCGNPYILLDTGNLAVHHGCMAKCRCGPIVRQHLSFIKAAFHAVDSFTVVKRIEAQLKPYIKQNQQSRTDAHGKAQYIQGRKRFSDPLALHNLREIVHYRKFNRSFLPNKSYPEIMTFSPECSPSSIS